MLETQVCMLGVLIAGGLSLLPDPLTGQGWEVCVCVCVLACVHPHVCNRV